MPTLREVRNRIRSVTNIAQITKALEAVSASRVRRAQARALASRAYSEKAWEILLDIQNATKGPPLHPLLTSREEINRVMLVVITSDRGLAGAYNTNIVRVAERFENRLGKPIQYVTIGRKGRDSLIRTKANVVAEFSDLPSELAISDISAISKLAIDAFLSGEVDEVLVAYTDFINMLTQRPVVLSWLPLNTETVANQVASDYVKDVPSVIESTADYEYEPGAEAILAEIVPRFSALMLYQALLEAQASEHAARMAAMRNATDNASQLIDDLTLEYNKARQATITGEILDIVGGAEALQASIDALAEEIISQAAMTVRKPKFKPAPTAVSAVESPAPAEAETIAEVAKSPAKKDVLPLSEPDDLTKVEGIGSKMSSALIDAGIDTYQKLADSSEETLQSAIENAGMRLAPSMGTWAEQAAYLAKGDLDGLEKFQNELVGGRRVDDN